MSAYQECENLILFCQRNGFVKAEYIEQLNSMNRILLESKLYYDALVKIEEALRLAQKYDIQPQIIQSLLLKA